MSTTAAASTAELRSEVEKSEAFRPAIGEFILITTAPDDAEIQKAARELENETRARGRPLTIAVWGWGRMQLEIVRYPAVLKAFHPDASPFTDLLIEQGEQIKHLVKQQLVEQRRAAERLAAIENTLLQAPISTVDLSATEFALDRHINEEIDTYRDLINAGRPRTAIHLLGGLAERLGAGTSSKIRFRIIANIGVAHHRLSEFSEAAIRFTDAYELNPDDQNSIANKIAALLIQSKAKKHTLWPRKRSSVFQKIRTSPCSVCRRSDQTKALRAFGSVCQLPSPARCPCGYVECYGFMATRILRGATFSATHSQLSQTIDNCAFCARMTYWKGRFYR